MSLVAAFWAPLMNQTGLQLVSHWLYAGLVFCLSALILGKWMLGERDACMGTDGKAYSQSYNALLWFAGGVACSCGFAISWQIALAAFAGMIAGSIIWPAKIWLALRQEADEQVKADAAAVDRQRENLREAAEIASLLNVPVDGENPEGWPKQ